MERKAIPEARFLESARDAVPFKHVLEPTRHRLHQTANVLDLVSDEEDVVSEPEVRDPLGESDHCYLQEALPNAAR